MKPEYTTILSKLHVPMVLISLYNKGAAATISDIQSNISTSNYDTVLKAVRKAEDAGLLTCKMIYGQGKFYQIELTDYGREIAADLKAVNDKLLERQSGGGETVIIDNSFKHFFYFLTVYIFMCSFYIYANTIQKKTYF